MTDTNDDRRPLSTPDISSAGEPMTAERGVAVKAQPKHPTGDADEPVGIQARETDVTDAEAAPGPASPDQESPAPLMAEDEATGFRSRWQDVQVDFVDDPKVAVERADALVAEVMQQLAREFARERESLEKQWSGGGQASTEDLRLALQRYRSFFSRLLTI